MIKDLNCYAGAEPPDFVLGQGAMLPVGLWGDLASVCTQVQEYASKHTNWTSFHLTDASGRHYKCLLKGTACLLYKRSLIPTVQRVSPIIEAYKQGRLVQLDCLLVLDLGVGLAPLLLRLDPERDCWVIQNGNDSSRFKTLWGLSQILEAWGQ